MAILDQGVESVSIREGWLTADVKVKTDSGVIGMRVSLELRRSPGLDALLPLIEAEIFAALKDRLGVAPVKTADA